MRHDQQERPGEETGAEERYLHNNADDNSGFSISLIQCN